MLIFVFSDNKKTEDIFSPLNTLKNNSIIFHPVKSLKKMISKIEKKSFIYLDAGKLSAAELKKNVNTLSKLDFVLVRELFQLNVSLSFANVLVNPTVPPMPFISEEKVFVSV